jgi:predicted AAA+ superfamily ATPase
MDETLFSKLILISEEEKKRALAYTKKRYLYEKIKNVPKGYFSGVCGLRGIGKTILLLQLANESENSLYFSADATYLKIDSIYDIVSFALSKGYENIFIDEIHHKRSWQQDLKTLYDEKQARICFSGSAALEIKKGADLSRRALIFHLNPLSFREFLSIKKGVENLEPITSSDIFDKKKRDSIIMNTSRYHNHLHEYFRKGGLLYPSDDEEYYYKALENTLEKIIHSDLEYLRAIDTKLENTIYRILEWIAACPVGEVSYSSLSSRVSITKPTLIKVIDDLVKIGLIRRVLPCGKDSVRKEPKLFLAFPFREFLNTQFMKKSDLGALREEFFVNHTEKTCHIKGKRGQKIPDYMLDGKVIEIGGSGKGFNQNPDFIMKESLSFEEQAIPLYLAGFLY